MTVTSTPPGIPSPARLENWLRETLPRGPAELGEGLVVPTLVARAHAVLDADD